MPSGSDGVDGSSGGGRTVHGAPAAPGIIDGGAVAPSGAGGRRRVRCGGGIRAGEAASHSLASSKRWSSSASASSSSSEAGSSRGAEDSARVEMAPGPHEATRARDSRADGAPLSSPKPWGRCPEEATEPSSKAV